MAAAINHISLDADMQVHLVKPKAATGKLAECIALMLCMLGCVITAMVTLQLPHSFTLILSVGVFSVTTTFLFNMRKYRGITILGILILLGIIMYSMWKTVSNAFWMINGNIVEAINKYYHTNYGYYMPGYTFDEYLSTVFVGLILSVIVLSLILGTLIILLKSPLGTFIVMLPFAYLAIEFGKEPHGFCLLLMLVGFLFTFSMYAINSKIFGKKISSFFVEKKKPKRIRYYFHNRNFQHNLMMNSGVVVLLIALALSMMISLFIPQNSYKPNNELKDHVQQLISDISNFKFTRFTTKVSGGGIGTGKLGDVDKLKYTNKVHLIVNSKIRTPFYLKGYVGAQYGKNKWEANPSETMKESQKLFADFKGQNTSPQNVEWLFMGLTDPNTLSQNTVENDISINNVAANKDYYYSPYFLNPMSYPFTTDFLKYEQDTMLKSQKKVIPTYTWKSWLFRKSISESENAYTSFYDPTMNEMAKQLKSTNFYYKTIKEYPGLAGLEEEYYKFVQDVYTRLPENKLNKLKADAETINQQQKNNPIEAKVKAVATFLSMNTKYSLSPARTPEEEDFAEYFLYKNKKGYCSHYATTATLMLRAMDIPARYVEGYTVTDKDYIKNEATIHDTNAHAWVEVYVSPIGWVPFEVTPGFSTESISQTNTEDLSSEPQAPSQPNVSSSTVSSDPNQDDLNLKKDQDGPVWKAVKTIFIGIFKFMLAAIGLIIICFVYLAIRRKIILKKRKAKMFNEKVNIGIIETYKYVNLLLEYLKYHVEEHKNEQVFAQYVDERCRYITQKGALKKVVTLALEAKYSRHDLSNDNRVFVMDFATTLANNIYQANSKWNKIVFKYVKALY
ncbi:transglutaminase-like domain-containing protein [Paludicola sp. MB14-C6]|uniref:transglutaminase-like domain-containing protein n=1 Tax=Paludihabitans sp. MB14-C6 TaxID=3070656 RepID=UPI0027DB3359|nr:transglutaminase-like domain-containing protein [Paludicola sp. MB14-C6]WMJ22432.1 transglutaminase-like domain-containing protein [Paludicola sp. MB14-C6]